MLYAVGTHIDLAHLNTKTERVKKSRLDPQRVVGYGYDTGTQFIFRMVNGRFVMARKINVAFA